MIHAGGGRVCGWEGWLPGGLLGGIPRDDRWWQKLGRASAGVYTPARMMRNDACLSKGAIVSNISLSSSYYVTQFGWFS